MAGSSSDADELQLVGEYAAPKAATVGDLLQKDGEDEALQRYKAQLLGAAAQGGGVVAGDPRRVVVTALSILVNGRDPITFDMTEHRAGGMTVVLQEGCEYRTQLSFRVQNEIVSGLQYKNRVNRGPLTVMKVDEMLGSYGPDAQKVIEVTFPRREWEQAPSGFTARGTYSCSTSFVDDDGKIHLEFDYKLQIKKDWQQEDEEEL